MKLREFTLAGILALGTVLVAALAAAQRPGKIARVGYLGSDSAPTPATPNLSLQAFRQGLGELGYVDGRDVIIETRWAEGRIEQLPALAAELVGLRVDVIVGVGAVVVRAAKSATTTLPIVMAVVIDPVEAGLVASLERPGGNITGLTTFDPQEAGKKLELLKEVLPGLERVALLADQDIRDRPLKAHEDQARALGLHPQGLKLAGANPDLERVFEAMTRERANALLVLEQPATVATGGHGADSPTWKMGARPRMMSHGLQNEEPCMKCHVDKRGPFVFEHAAVRVDGCSSCHVPHGSMNARLLKRPQVFTMCLECHNGAGNFGRQADGIILTPSSHNMTDPKFQNCTLCHTRIHGSNSNASFLR